MQADVALGAPSLPFHPLACPLIPLLLSQILLLPDSFIWFIFTATAVRGEQALLSGGLVRRRLCVNDN